jgi:hypothetical protein
MVMLGDYWGHGASAVMAVIGVTWLRVGAWREPVPVPEGQGPERRLADVLEFPAPKLPSEFEVFAERARLLG